MKGFGTFDTTNTLYGNFYSREQDPVTNIPKFKKPNMEEVYYNQTIEMKKGYFNRYAHLYPDPTGKAIYNPIDGKAFKEEQGNNEYIPKEENINNTIEKPDVYGHEMTEKNIGEEPVMKTFHRNYESQ